MESKKDLEDYLSDIMDLDNFYHREFINSLMQRWTPRQRPVSQVIPDSAFVSFTLHILFLFKFYD